MPDCNPEDFGASASMIMKSRKVLKFVLPRNSSLAGFLVDVATVVVFLSFNISSSISMTTISLSTSSAGMFSIRRLVLD